MATTGVRVATAERHETLELSELDRQWAETQSRTKPHVQGYTTQGPLGEGAFGEVWSAEHSGTKAPVAIKFFRHSSGWQRLHDEIKQLGTLQGDPNIIAVLNVADPDEKGRPYYVMRRADSSLADQIKAGPLPLAQALTWFKQIVRAMVFVHAKGIRHCDLKPGNILIEADGRALVADFGQAHLSHDSTPALGTLFYMAPEQATLTEQVPDTAWDVYGLGALLYAMLTGHPPRAPEHVRDEIDSTPETGKKLARYRQWLKESPLPDAHRKVAGMDRELAAVIDRCLAVDPANRYSDARAIQYALDRRERRLRQRPWLAFALVAPLVLMLVIGLLGWWAASGAIKQSRQQLVDQRLEGNLAAARLVAAAVDERLELRSKTIQDELAKDVDGATVESHLATALKEKNWDELQSYIKAFHDRHEDAFFRWHILDVKGVLRAAEGQNEQMLKVNAPVLLHNEEKPLAFRGWFNGKVDFNEAKSDHYEPLKEPHISHPYFGITTQQGVICFSAPVVDRETGKVVGVLGAQVTMKDPATWVSDVEISRGCVVLINELGYCVYHPDPNDPKHPLQPEKGKRPKQMIGEPIESFLEKGRKHVGKDSPELISTYEDSIYPTVNGKRKPHLAAMKVLPESKWVAIVQHELEAVDEPVKAMESLMYRGLWTTLGTSLALMLGLWGCLYSWLRREEQVSHA